ncbi:MAG TPA: hypothetical protein VMW83_02710 [Spirochaetia bacterium]|nr:hypothetical protein [Spirochaetia bacterium]
MAAVTGEKKGVTTGLAPLFQREKTVLEFHPVTSERWPDLARFSARHGRFGWCSCMRWRMSSTEFRDSTKADRQAALAKLVGAGIPVGVLGYRNGQKTRGLALGMNGRFSDFPEILLT